MRECEGTKWALGTGRLEPCENLGQWEHQGRFFCYFCWKCSLGLITSERRSAQQVARAEPDPFAVLAVEWA